MVKISKFSEGGLLEIVHKESYLPGIPRVASFGPVPGIDGKPIETTSLGDQPKLQKYRMLIADVGQSLDTCISVYQFLRVMHDSLSTQINLYCVRRVLHCRIDSEHIMVGGSQKDPLPKENTVYKRGDFVAAYIKEILGDPIPNESPAQLSESLLVSLSRCVVIGVDGYMEELREEEEPHRFMARSVARRQLLPLSKSTIFPSLPRMDTDINRDSPYRRYLALSDVHYLNYHACINAGFEERKTKPPMEYWHQFFHDAESTLWVLTDYLVRALPLGCSEHYADGEAYRVICEALYITPPGDRVMYPAASQWAKFLHPELVSLAGMLGEMHRYMAPEWALIANPTRPDHAHEALRRMAFKQIAQMLDGDQLKLSTHKRHLHPEVQKKLDEINEQEEWF
ncbi:hypothetical protein BDV93DRAFT_603240 [Ceratobasidium sp. AG-I]|nr:hypothetical protein BDV93DRAFT_603240 [Ceratobasidium sp. AG-I]